MLREDVEIILAKSFSYFKSKMGNRVDLGELKQLSNRIMDELTEKIEYEKEICPQYIITPFVLSMLRDQGDYKFKDIHGNIIVLKYENEDETPSVLESGAFVIWDKEKEQYDISNAKEKREDNAKKPVSTVQTILKQNRLRRKRKHVFDHGMIDFDKLLQQIDDLICSCINMRLEDELKTILKLQSTLRDKRLDHLIMNERQKTLNDFA